MNSFDNQYLKIVKNVLNMGYKDINRTGINTIKLPHQIMQFDLSREFPISQTKFVAFKTAVKEILWIMQKQSNIVEDLRKEGVKIWNEWEMEDGTIGLAYGEQVRKFHQIDNLIEALKNNPQDRRMMINLWNWEDLPKMSLAPCCFLSMWDVSDGKLNCMLVQRSGDLGLGVPFNTTQYAVLTHLIAQATGLEVGLLTHVINNAHIYENQIQGLKEQLKRDNDLFKFKAYEKIGKDYIDKNFPNTEEQQKYSKIVNTITQLNLNKNINNFYDFKIEDITLENYEHMGKIDMGNVAI